ncbi:hypothetical protein FDA94_29145 [Herbidospora galbida]|uniref:Uncharacterized protein n=1 Tax=Herbidospora galbida TaxID=2575442 RepID=A0A4U3M8N3_9ACTN|nr:hypothetical protein [Herbidospora galbida]TKK84682.1 hypothetical protein FDA94_29145 [Herbidospora galbida]
MALAIAIGTVLPILTGLVTKQSWGAGFRAFVLAVLSGATGFLTELKGSFDLNTSFDLTAALLTWLLVALTGVGVHLGFLKPTGISTAVKNTLVKD